MAHQNPSTSQRMARTGRATALVAAAASGLIGLSACGSDDDGVDAVSTDQIQEIEDDLTALEDRVGVLEGQSGASVEELMADPQAYLGQEVTVTDEVSRLWTTADTGAAFQIGGNLAVLSDTERTAVDANDDVRVTGTVTYVRADTFEEDFGITADQLLADPDGFLTDVEGSLALAADRIEVLEPSDE
ncbi:hypothetical protein [Blastococcus litoris]|uniref:hypothetical protein n=1 Tax=Blastococcus litoris TaxID=2171622 RepID=UPI0013DFCE11|nr:hypothetical protein [Blastococcus litoris]